MASRYKPPSTRNIRRIDSPKSHGYQVHIERNGHVFTKHFSDSQYPSPAKARKAAMEYRDRMLAELPPSQPQQGFRMRAHSNTGEVGISLTHMARKTGDKKPYITVSVSPEPGKMLGRKFSIERYGYEGAIREARAWRDSVLQERQRKLERQRQKDQRRLGDQLPVHESVEQPADELDDSIAEAQAAPPVAAINESPEAETASQPRRRGRPRKQPDLAVETSEQPPKRRGRPPKRALAESSPAPAANTTGDATTLPRRRRATGEATAAPLADSSNGGTGSAPMKRGRGRPPKHAKA